MNSYDNDNALIDVVLESGKADVSTYMHDGVVVVIGRSGKVDVELNIEAIEDDGVQLLRRRGGGCSVVLDPGNLIISVALPLFGVGGITTAFSRISSWLIDNLAACGVPDVKQMGVSDLAIKNRKIGGSCIYRTKGLLYYTTTLLLDPKQPLMDKYLKHPPREPDYRAGRAHNSFTTSLKALELVKNPAEFCQKFTEMTKSSVASLFDEIVHELPSEQQKHTFFPNSHASSGVFSKHRLSK